VPKGFRVSTDGQRREVAGKKTVGSVEEDERNSLTRKDSHARKERLPPDRSFGGPVRGADRLLPVTDREIVVGVSGASGASLPRRFVELAARSPGIARLHLVFSESSLLVARSELDAAFNTPKEWVAALDLPREVARRIVLHGNDEVGATIASGSYPVAGMAVIPCSAGTLGAIANGISRDLLQRAADVCLKERRPLVLAFRESPYSLVHVENMRRVTLAGAIVAPPTPAFYVKDPSMARFLDAWCARVARFLGIELPGAEFRWTGTGGRSSTRRRPR
jgi:4-hydroxy-3-polyprenylbenzoate decarboxylase